MKILCLADLHLINNPGDLNKISFIQDLLNEYKPDVVAIAGDIIENYIVKENPYKILSYIFKDTKVICVLGNHEFAMANYNNIIKLYTELYNPDKYDVHYLDIIGNYTVGDYNFIGNVLWYDGSLKNVYTQIMWDFANINWLDSTIRQFNYLVENAKCKKQIRDNYSYDKKNIMITHCVPHADLNLWQNDISTLNAYSGCKDFLLEIKPTISICGHTHRRVLKTIKGIDCINVGNDYRPTYQYYLMEV